MTKLIGDMLEEMLVQILSRLPPKSLVRFRCVCKLWYTIINDPSFVAKNLSISKHNKFSSVTSILVKHTLLKDRSTTDEAVIAALKRTFGDYTGIDLLLSFLHICNDDGDDLTYDVEDSNVLFPSSLNPGWLQIAGHCDGIVCLNNSADVVLCNPAIREFRVLPESCAMYDLPPREEDEDHEPWSHTGAVGFGLDSKSKEYKVVRVVDIIKNDNTLHRAEVYTMGANSWRELENFDKEYCPIHWAPSFAMHYKGTFYWWACWDYLMYEDLIITFDMSEEQFHQVPMPYTISYTDRRYRSLAVLNESLVLFTYEDDVPKCFDIWMMDESTGVKGSWTKYLTLGLVEGIKIPLVFWNSEELLMVSNRRRVVSYNLGTKKLHHFPIQGVEDPEKMQAINYVYSMISVKNTASQIL